jgi:hypothetical protein
MVVYEGKSAFYLIQYNDPKDMATVADSSVVRDENLGW